MEPLHLGLCCLGLRFPVIDVAVGVLGDASFLGRDVILVLAQFLVLALQAFDGGKEFGIGVDICDVCLFQLAHRGQSHPHLILEIAYETGSAG
ncbi:hypothetical protein D3C85_1553930 [compost metagenome]